MGSQYRQLEVWQKARAFVAVVYQLTKAFPSGERYGLTQQIRRAAVSIPSNIAEGCGRGTQRDYLRFLQGLVRSLEARTERLV